MFALHMSSSVAVHARQQVLPKNNSVVFWMYAKAKKLTICTACKVWQVELDLVPPLIQAHGHCTDEGLHSCRWLQTQKMNIYLQTYTNITTCYPLVKLYLQQEHWTCWSPRTSAEKTYLVVWRPKPSPDVLIIQYLHFKAEVLLQVLDNHNQEG